MSNEEAFEGLIALVKLVVFRTADAQLFIPVCVYDFEEDKIFESRDMHYVYLEHFFFFL